jgi:hypothetical protein
VLQKEFYNTIPCQSYRGLKLVEQQKTDITEESTTAAVIKVNKKENKEGSIVETEKGKDQENAAGAEIEDLNK